MKKLITILLVLISCSTFAQWQQMSGSGGISYLSLLNIDGTTMIAGSSIGILTSGDLYRSTNGGNTWSVINTGFQLSGIFSLAKKDNIIFAGTYEDGLFKSTNNGVNWENVAVPGGFGTGVFKLGISVQNVFGYMNTGQAYYISSNNGANWSVAAGINGGVLNQLIDNPPSFYCATVKGLYKSTNNGFNWTRPANIGLPQQPDTTKRLTSIAVSNGVIYGSLGGPVNAIYKTTNEGVNWDYAGITISGISYFKDLAAAGNKIFACVQYGSSSEYGVYMTSNGGANWQQVSLGLPVGGTINDLMVVGDELFAATMQNGIWKVNISQLTGITNISNSVPEKFLLEQNYPNPFNPSTKIKFAVPNSGAVKLVVYDGAGREVSTLVDQSLNAGSYEAEFNASSFSSGVYYYKLVSGGFSETRKMILTK